MKKKIIFKNIIEQYNLDFNFKAFNDDFYYDTPGNLLKYLILFNNNNIDINNDKISCILYLIEKYKSKKDFALLSVASLFIELFYNELSIKNKNKLNYYYLNKQRAITEINDMKNFNLDKKSLLISLEGILKNEQK